MSTIWENIEIHRRDSLVGRIDAECVVIGAGLSGIMTAYELKRRGCEVVVLEAGQILSGATKGTTAKLSAQQGFCFEKMKRKISPLDARLYYDSNKEAIDKVERLSFEEDISCDFKRVDSHIYSETEERALKKERDALSGLQIECEYTEKTPLPFSVKAALKMKNQAQFQPLKFAAGLSRKLNIYEKSPVIKVRKHGVLTPKGEVRARYVVNCTHYPILSFPGLYFLRQHQERSYILAIKTESRVGGIFLSDEGVSLRDYEEGVLLGGEAHRTGENEKGGCYMKLAARAHKLFPKGEIVASWSNQDAMTHDGLPFIGRYSFLYPEMYVATGFNKWGMSLSSVASSLIPDLIEGRKNPYEKLYSPQRVRFSAAASKFLVDAGYSAKGLLEGVFADRGERCTHLGCKLCFNADEGTFECPCHGSEFTRTGEVMFSPAKKHLKNRK